MITITTIIQIIVGLSIYYVWLFRFNKATQWRGGNAQNMREEFQVYGLSQWFMNFVGFLKILFASLLIISIFVPILAIPAASGLIVLMLSAVIMHIKVNDSLVKTLPAFSLLVLSLIILGDSVRDLV